MTSALEARTAEDEAIGSPDRPAPMAEPRRNDADTLALEILEKLTYAIGKDPAAARRHDWLQATTLAVRDRIIDRWFKSTHEIYDKRQKRVCYLSMEFLIGRLLRDAIDNLGLTVEVKAALSRYDVDIEMIELLEPDAALGNGGLGRLAACFMESMASTGVPAFGYGIRYVHGFFRQEIVGGEQVELPETWLAHRQSLGIRASRNPPTRSASAERSPRSTNPASRRGRSGARPSAFSPSPTTRPSSAGAAST